MKKILFVINTLGRAGAETALLELLRRLDAEEYEISLYVLLVQGEMISQVPQRVHVKNKKICTASVLSGAGRRKLIQTSFLAFFRHGRTIKKMQYVIQNFFRMKKTGNIQPDKKNQDPRNRIDAWAAECDAFIAMKNIADDYRAMIGG